MTLSSDNARRLTELAADLKGDLYTSRMQRRLYATDASVYQEVPTAVALPRSEEDLRRLVRFATQTGIPLIPRTAGTSLAGQVVGDGIVVDLSKHFTRVLAIHPGEGWARVQPGVIRNELNQDLAPHGLLFGPETSTANRAMIGGMVGNNSCGSNSIVYGSTRDHLLEVRGILSDGSEAVFGPLTAEAFRAKCDGPPDRLETRIYRAFDAMLRDPANRRSLTEGLPGPEITRRNMGYALDSLLRTAPFEEGGAPFNFCRLVAGAEGTLLLVSEIKLACVPLPPPAAALVCIHCRSVDEALRANLEAVRHGPYACELIDRHILECTQANRSQRANRFFLRGDPGAILVVELRGRERTDVEAAAGRCIAALRNLGLGYEYPTVWGSDRSRVWDLRKAGLGLLYNIPGDTKPATVIEDTAVAVRDLPDYIREFNAMLKERYGLECVHYAHAGSGELHLRPMLNLKTREGRRLFRAVARDVAALVARYRGSLSGEHGDGRLRGEFLRDVIGEANYRLMQQAKHAWDPRGLFNPGKIVDTPPMDTGLRYAPGQPTPQYATAFDFSAVGGVLRAAEMCNGSGDCRKTHRAGGTMCPSYMATRDEKDTTRARANLLRQVLTQPERPDPFADEELKEVMDLCLSCKGCTSECPSNVDLARLKAEWQYQYYQSRGVPRRARMIAANARLNRWLSLTPRAWNAVAGNRILSRWVQRVAGFSEQRSLPRLHPVTLRAWFRRRRPAAPPPGLAPGQLGAVRLFCDEFTNYYEPEIGMHAVTLLERLGFAVDLPEHPESGRAAISKGLLDQARRLAEANVRTFAGRISENTPLIGLEPSAILGFRDEYPDLVGRDEAPAARALGPHCLLFDEFIARAIERGQLRPEAFTDAPCTIHLHGHCHQKALSSPGASETALTLPANYRVHTIPSGCCGMAGSFGYEAEHYDLSMRIGELVLFPAVRNAAPEDVVCAPGASCRQQILDGTGRHARHPATILHQALRPTNA